MPGLSIRTRLFVLFLLVAVAPLVAVGYGLLSSFEQSVTRAVLQDLSHIADKKVVQIDSHVEERLKDLKLVASEPDLRSLLSHMVRNKGGALLRLSILSQHVDPHLIQYMQQGNYKDLLLIAPDGRAVMQNLGGEIQRFHLFRSQLNSSHLAVAVRQAMKTTQPVFSQLAIFPIDGLPSLFLVHPILEEGGVEGVIALRLDASRFEQVARDNIGLGKTGETVLARAEGESALFLFNLKFDQSAG
ncbi:cache domain-containing protein, partial [Magnetococcus sp. PR-3]|uniref:cache domain-containing protein n=1 Tax=Magnetococcus sp. PR-3 TaxID=3120355 RepID=UPI002FCE0E94